MHKLHRNVGDDDLFTIEDDGKSKKKEKSLEELLADTDNMFKDIEDKQDDLDLNLNVDDDFNFDQYINQQTADSK